MIFLMSFMEYIETLHKLLDFSLGHAFQGIIITLYMGIMFVYNTTKALDWSEMAPMEKVTQGQGSIFYHLCLLNLRILVAICEPQMTLYHNANVEEVWVRPI